MDAIVDNYFIILENMGEKIEILQESVLTEPDPSNLREIQEIRREMDHDFSDRRRLFIQFGSDGGTYFSKDAPGVVTFRL